MTTLDPAARRWAALGAVLVGLGVALGAFGAHALEDVLREARLATFETAVRYQTTQGLGLLLLALAPARVRIAAPLLAIGIVIFCGSLYLIVGLDIGAFGAIAPIGGIAMIGAWAVAAWRLLRP